MVIMVPSDLTVSKCMKRLTFSNTIPASCCFLQNFTPEGYKYEQRMRQKGEEKEGKKMGLHTQVTHWCAGQQVDARSQITAGMPKGRRETPQGLSAKSMPEFHRSSCRESMA